MYTGVCHAWYQILRRGQKESGDGTERERRTWRDKQKERATQKGIGGGSS